MNLALIQDTDIVSRSSDASGDVLLASLTGRQHEHIVNIQKLGPGRELQVGLINGNMGRATISAQDESSTHIEVCLTLAPPKPNPITLVLALPRPLMLKRVLQTATSLGVKDIHLIHSNKVEKSYWQSPQLNDEELHEQLLLGLEQGVDTVLPHIHKHQRFRPFAEDILPGLVDGKKAFVAHPSPDADTAQCQQEECYLAIGPEGGFTEYEVEKLQDAGMQPLSLGPRILRVETAVPVLLAKLS
ncbi:16S rRNA (uracil(1498)-N(3))-methyltransferase [Pseudoteredinibacter isoporae]|uniref:Ribosomal RNA small subunit methyltransferase E n=1 Tax=Pseudoteredinibacter isoporae TaxID=570281 RepID=A0A7X0JXI8_9GAMM|nr:16S rRNA (uracil(1498)-N(3))-methyltransferase [Pseudoteredinibacter isoporae]MBB6523508.1 RsmE family RNA methyltransferase [Pseudoteredinibacter isoporae]NHO89017.1 16S rRNA (uracil(1498)-N(3))-methyltransferase [Pseudoteredinibacter isoporae]NIB24275.1 16S rRNA (uracil(1498)-N(3))-methyltransferase [Pseudoteredinibacter isoporae]